MICPLCANDGNLERVEVTTALAPLDTLQLIIRHGEPLNGTICATWFHSEEYFKRVIATTPVVYQP